MKYFLWIFILVEIFGRFMGVERINRYLDIAWLIFGLLFIAFLIVHGWMDRKGMFMPNKMYKKKQDREG